MDASVTLTIHRAANEIGGNCVEIATSNGGRIILDIGRPLDAPPDAKDLLAGTLDRNAVAHVLISHPHQDHFGLLDEIPPEWPVHCGAATADLIALTDRITGKNSERKYNTWKSGQALSMGEFFVTPYLTDHSAFDAHMLLVEIHGKRILYSGDFRTHGRKGELVRRFMASPPPDIDVLVMEGTNLGSDKPTMSEHDLEDDFAHLFSETRGRVFVAWSAQNIDRTVTLYRAAKKSGRTLVVDLYTAEVLETLGAYGRIPQPDWDSIKVMVTSRLAQMYRKTGREHLVERYARNGIAARGLNETPGRWVCMFRSSLVADLERNEVIPTSDDAWSWSMWKGYLTEDDGRLASNWFTSGGARSAHIHTSGHASPTDLREFAKAMRPRRIVPVHGIAWDAELSGFPPITRLMDGQSMVI
ncbi:MBL fold metallo-hydrolase [Shinella zoogloeoides]|uniref:MBL fold metallo-hydrolase n=1 Tax=Shinella zoogloeoides TaxID=352475 RepID=UPI0028B03274|nr:MBL fold metallo-hydrolase [Shinella zoogloeoides]